MNGHAIINRLYRLVWSEVQNGWVAVAENVRGRGKASGRSKLAAALFAGVSIGLTPAAWAGGPAPTAGQLPTGGTVAAGAVNITQSGHRMDVTQTSPRGAIDWGTFNVGSQAQVNFAQPSATAVTLNRVQDTQASQIHGRITSNGQVFLSNPNGVYFSPTSSADVGGLVATTGTLSTADFMAGRHTFTREGATGSVVNEGHLTASLGGYIALLAPEVRNHGIVTAQAGTVALASGEAIELQFDNSKSLTGVLVSPSAIAALVENGSAVRAPGGVIIMSAQAADQLQGAVVRNSGTLEATAMTTRGGKIVLDSSGLIDNAGSANVSGPQGGRITVRGDRMLSGGSLRADGTALGAIAQGGTISSTLAQGLVETRGAVVSATGGGHITVDAGAGQLYSSATYTADGLAAGQQGGSVTLTADKIALMGASVSASGHAGGGSVRVGGDLHGANAAVANAQTTTIGKGVKLSADATAKGEGGKVVVWSDDTTNFSGAVSAKGGANGGNGGQLEVSGKGTLHFSGTGNASAAHGTSGTLLLDPKDIFIDDQVSAQVEYIDPHSSSGGTFGASVTSLTTLTDTSVTAQGVITGTATHTGYIVITNPTDTLGGIDAGAAYLFRQSDQALISTLYGTHSGDQVGTTVTTLTNGNFVVSSPNWNNKRGAVTWGSGTLGWGGGSRVEVSSSNSLIGTLAPFVNSAGSTVSDAVGASSQVKALVTGNYIVIDSGWGDGVGAVAFGNGISGSSGTISSTNALVGSTVTTQLPSGNITYKGGDGVGGGITFLPNGNYVLANKSWNKGVGAVSLGSGTTGISGVVSASNSLVGTTSRADATGNGNGTDKVGDYLTVLTGSEFIVYTSSWNTSNTLGSAGAVTWSDGSTLPVGVVSSSNSLVGNQGDYLSSGNVTLLPSNNAFVIRSTSWNSGSGAATWAHFGTNVKTINLSTNGVTGATSDLIGSKEIAVLANGDYVISSPNWQSGRGAVTLVDGSTGKTKVDQGSAVTASNSLVGSQITDNVGQNGILALTGNGNFLALSPFWSSGGTSKVGAVTWSSGTTPTVGAVSSSNSLVGSYANDRIGEGQYITYSNGITVDNQQSSLTALSNGNYVVASPMWSGTRGAVTLGDGSTGSVGAVTSSNSLVGSSIGDYVGSFSSPIASSGGTPAFFYLSNGVRGLANGNFIVVSDFWKNGGAVRAGAVTWSSGTSNPTVGAVSSTNSVVGSTANDLVGYNAGQFGITALLAGFDGDGNQLYTSNYVITSGSWDNGATVDAGALTWGSGTAGSNGVISNVNSVVGNSTAEINQSSVTALARNGNYLILDSLRDIGSVVRAGALTLVDGSTGHVADYAASGNKNVISATNSLVGSTTDDFQYAGLVPLYTATAGSAGKAQGTGNYVLASYYWDHDSLADAGAVTWGSGTAGVTGVINRSNSLVGEKAGDYLGGYVTFLPTGDYVVGNPTRDIGVVVNAGAATWVAGSTGHVSDYATQSSQNIVSAANSLVGSHPNDYVGDGVYSFFDAIGDYNRTGYFIFSTSWNCFAGALTYVNNGAVPLIGVVDATNSAVGDPNGYFVGGLSYSPYPTLVPNTKAMVTFGGDGGHLYEVMPVMPATGGMALASATQYGDAASATQMITPDYVADVLKTGTHLTLQASNDILVRGAIDATGGTAGGSLTLDAGRSIAILGDIITGNRDLTVVANDTLAHGVNDAARDAGIATISMGTNTLGHVAVIDAGTGSVSMTMSAGADKTNAMGGSISLNSVSAARITILNHGDGAGTSSDLPTLADCCGYIFGTQSEGANIELNTGATLHATGSGTAVSLSANGQFINSSGNAANSIDITNPGSRWLVYASAPGTSSFGGLDSGNTAVWNQTYDPNVAVAATGNRYVFAYQPTVTVSTQDINKTYGVDLSTGTALADLVMTISGGQAGVTDAFVGDTLSSAISGTAIVTSAGAAATAGVAGGPYAINVDLSQITGNNGYAVALGSNTPHTLAVTTKALTASLTNVTKTYDGNTTAALTNGNYVLSGLVNSDTFTVTKSGGTYNVSSVAAASASTTLVSGDFTGVSGALAGNYTLPTTATGSATITPKALTATLTGVTKTYDGDANATLATGNYTLVGFVGSQSATVTQTAGSYNAADVLQATSASTTLASGDFMAGSGTSLVNYTLPTSASGAATITPHSLTTTLSGSLGKTYDGTTAQTLSSANFNVTGFIGGQSATVTQTSGVFNSATVAAATTVTATLASLDYTAGNGTTLSNYVLPTSASTSASISRANLTVTANNATRTYDGTAYNGGNGVSYNGFVNSETSTVLGGSLTYGGTSQGASNVGNYTIVPGGLTAANYSLSFIAGALAINPVQLVAVTANLTGNLGKTYDGTNVATLTSANYNLVGFVNGDSATVTQTSGTYDGLHAGSHTVTVSLANSDFSAGSGTQLSNYSLPTSASGTGLIAQKAVTLTAPTITKVYDGSVSYATTLGNLATLSSALVSSDTVNTATLTYTDKNAGAGNRTVGLSAVTVNDGNNGGNYIVTLAGNTNSTITPRTLTVGATATHRIYDATTHASVSLSDNRVGGDVLTVTDTSAQFANKNAGTGKTVNVTGLSLAGTDASNYVLASTTTTATADVTPATLVISGVSAANRAYNTQMGVTFAGTPTVTALGSDVVTLGGTPTATTADKNVGLQKAVTVSGYTTNDTNYVLVQPAGLTVDITPAVLALSGLSTTNSRTYDGTRHATLTGTPTVTGLNSEIVTLSGTAVGQFADKNVGATKAITVSGLTTNDPNYVVGQVPDLNASVTPANLVVSGVSALGRAYDTQTGIALTGTPTIAPIAGDVVTLSGSPIASVANKNAGTGKAVIVSGYAINDSNYVIVQPQGLTVDITAAVLQLGGLTTSTATKTYDGTTTVALSGTPVVTGLNGEVVALSGTALGQTADKNVGIGKSITVSGLVTSDPNYTIGQDPALTAHVTPATLAVTGMSAINRAYNTQTGVALGGTPTITPIAGDVVMLSGTPTASVANKNAGTGKAVSVSGYVINDSNYVLMQPQGLTVDIAQALLQLGGLSTDSATKTYDGSTSVMLSGTPTITGLNGEVVTVSGTAVGHTADKNVGSGKVVAVTGLVPSDPNYAIGQESGLSINVTPASLLVTGMTAINRSYNTQTGVALAGAAMITPIEGDVVTLSGTPSATLADKNAGMGKAVSVTGYAINNSNYVIVQPTGLTVDIAAAILQLSGLATSPSKTYDATRHVALNGTPTLTGLNGEVVTVMGTAVGQMEDKNVGTGKVVTISGLSIADSNYVIGQESGLSINVTPASLLVSGVTAVNRTYNTQTGVALAGTATITPLGDDVVALGGSGSGSVADKSAGFGKVVIVTGYTIGNTNYTLVQPVGIGVDIARAVLQLGGVTTAAGSQTYDGTRNVLLTGTPAVTGLNGEVVTLSGTLVGTLADKNVGPGKAITVSGLSPSDANYAVGQEPGLVTTVTPAMLVVSGVSANSKQFDGNATASLSGNARITPVAGDDVALTGTPSAGFANADVGTGKGVTVSGYGIAGSDYANYVLTQPVNLSADVTAPPVVPAPVVLPPPSLPTPPASPALAVPAAALQAAPVVTLAAAPVATTSSILVSLVREPSLQLGGVITVSVPKEIASAGHGFSFPMPTQIVEAAAVGRVQVVATTQSGAPLPSWVHYDAEAKTFVVTDVPAGGLPLKVLVVVGGQSTLVSISER